MIRRKAVRLVAARELRERLRSRASWILTGLTVVLAIVLVLVPSLLNQPSGPTVIGLVGPQAQTLAPTLHAAAKVAKVDITTTDVDSEVTARSELTPSQSQAGGRVSRLFSGKKAPLDIAVLVQGNNVEVEVYQSISSVNLALIRSTLNILHQRLVLLQAGLSAATLNAAEQPVPVTTVTLSPAPTDKAARTIAALATGFLLMYGVAGYGTAVATGVAQEKTSRTAELLVAALRPQELLIGKVLGIGIVGVAQMAVTVGAAMLTNAIAKSAAIPSGLETFLPDILVWFVLGYTLYAFGYAAAGAMVARQEELPSITVPFTILLVLALFLMYATVANPDSPLIRILSFLPPLAPVLMSARLALGHAAGWEFALAVAIELIAIAGTAALAARIYQGALVRGGARLSWAEALRVS
jgi:ABC-2 type transport system permease protein